jgi:hypothetical protein
MSPFVPCSPAPSTALIFDIQQKLNHVKFLKAFIIVGETGCCNVSLIMFVIYNGWSLITESWALYFLIL